MSIGNYPPKLVRIVATGFGSLLTLTDGRAVPINIAPKRLSQALKVFERPPLSELLAARSLVVYAETWETTADEWQQLSAVVLASPVAVAAFGQVPSVWREFGQPAAFVRELPQRVYGGLDQAIYTSHPFHFRTDPNRPVPWRRGLLSASGGRLFNTWVHPISRKVEVESDLLVGHYVE